MVPDPGRDADFARLLSELPEAWSGVHVDDDTKELTVAWAHIRAAYGVGYMSSLADSARRRDTLTVTTTSKEEH